MKKITIFIGIFLISINYSCQQREGDLTIYDLHYQVNTWLNDENFPSKFLDDTSPIKPVRGYDTTVNIYGDTILIWLDRNGKECGSQKLHIQWEKEAQKIVDLYESREYRNYIAHAMGNEFLYSTLLIGPVYGKLKGVPYNKSVPKGVYIGGSFRKGVNLVYTCNKHKLNLKLKTGDSNWGLDHIIEGHTPLYYIINNKLPSVYKTLFLESSPKYIKRLIRRFLEKDDLILSRSKKNSKNMVLEGEMCVTEDIIRNYILCYNEKTGNIITFYPETKFTPQDFGILKNKGYFEYVEIKEKTYQLMEK